MKNNALYKDAVKIAKAAIAAASPDEAVRRALSGRVFPGRVFLVAIGKAAWQMARTAADTLGETLSDGVVITKYGHVPGQIMGIRCFEAGHPIPDENSFCATDAVLEMTAALNKTDSVLFLISGGGSALFEKPYVSGEELKSVTSQLLSCGADIVEINIIRKRLSAVKGGRFAKWCEPASIYSVILSDILGDPLDMIASGPAAADYSTCSLALDIVNKYKLSISQEAMQYLNAETPKKLNNVYSNVIGSVRELCSAAMRECESLGYHPVFLTDHLQCEAKEAGSFLASILKSHADTRKNLAFIAGGETVVHIKSDGKGGRNQELALSAAIGIDGLYNSAVISIGSDGTDGPTDAAGGYADGFTLRQLMEKGINIYNILDNNDSYNALKAIDQLIITGPTGTNVNDISIALITANSKSMTD